MLTNSHKKHSAWLKHNSLDIFFIVIILGLTLYISFKNYVPGTWLLGWDDLVPELNLKLNIARSLSAVWQEYQGVGLLGGMAHAADLPRQIILLIFSTFVPVSFLRYLWTFLMLAAGPLGIYFLFKSLVKEKGTSAFAAFSSAIFYLFNLATVQIFFTPFETFVGFFGFLPWLIYGAVNYFKSGDVKRLFIYVVISVLATGAFYVQTLFVVYAIILGIFAIESIIRAPKQGIKRVFLLGLTTLFINAFWLLPVGFFTATSGEIPGNSHINSMATPETQLLNQARSDWKDLATLKGYWFDYYDWGVGKFDYLYSDWILYSNQSFVIDISLVLFGMALIGLLFGLVTKKMSYGASLFVIFGISIVLLSSRYTHLIPFFSEIFRNSFTKWSNALSFVMSIGIGILVYSLTSLNHKKLGYLVGSVLAGIVVAISVLTVKPVFDGKLIADSMRVNLPDDYIETVNYFKTVKPTKRIAMFPLTDLFGWKFNSWGYRGSGFLWYGIEQPILDRAFDVWSPFNEVFYDEVARSVNAGDTTALQYLFAKYQVDYILWDGSVILPGNLNSDFILQRQKQILENSGFTTKVFESGDITVYKVNLFDSDNFLTTPKYDLSKPYFTLSKIGEVSVKETFPSVQGYETAKNCDLKSKGSVTRERGSDGNFYGAHDGGIACDYFYYPNIDYSKAYRLRIKGENISGRALKIYLYHVKNRDVELQELLPQGVFDKTYIIYPTSSSEDIGMGYTLTVETRSFGQVKSENKIEGIEFMQVASSKLDHPQIIDNDLKILDSKKYGTWAYQVEVTGNGLLKLGQGYDEGWISLQKLNHTKIDGWANGFTVETGQSRLTIYLFYWPQVLEWIGMGLGILTILSLFLSFKSKQKHIGEYTL